MYLTEKQKLQTSWGAPFLHLHSSSILKFPLPINFDSHVCSSQKST